MFLFLRLVHVKSRIYLVSNKSSNSRWSWVLWSFDLTLTGADSTATVDFVHCSQSADRESKHRNCMWWLVNDHKCSTLSLTNHILCRFHSIFPGLLLSDSQQPIFSGLLGCLLDWSWWRVPFQRIQGLLWHGDWWRRLDSSLELYLQKLWSFYR